LNLILSPLEKQPRSTRNIQTVSDKNWGIAQSIFFLPSAGTSPDFFSVSAISTAGSRRSAGSCNDANIQLTLAMSHSATISTDSTNYFCGGNFARMGAADGLDVLRSDALPFNVRYVVESTASVQSNNIGFRINWRQVPCGSLN